MYVFVLLNLAYFEYRTYLQPILCDMNRIKDIWSYLFEKPLLTVEQFEEIRMLTSFSLKEIRRLRKYYLDISNDNENLRRDQFLTIPSIQNNPLKDRIAFIFGFSTEKKSTITFKKFIHSLSMFNAVERLEDKLKVAFQLQDFDNDGIISREDLTTYITMITGSNLSKEELEEIVEATLTECATDPATGITPANFQEVVSTTDFQTKIHIYI